MYRDNEETFRLADGNTTQRVEKGEPSHAMLFMQNLNVSYSLQASKNSLFSATFRLRGNNQPNWDYQGVLYNVNDETDMVNMIDRTKNSWTRPSLDLYYQQNLKKKQTLVFNLVGTYNREKSHRIYQESLHNEILTDINNNVLGDKYSIIGEAIYEKQFSKGNALSFGLQHTQSYSNNEYRNGHNYDTRMNQGNSYIFSEYRGKINKLDYRLGISLTRFYYNQSGNDDSSKKYNVNPKATLHYTFSENSYLRWKAEVFNATPSLSNLSAIEQTIDSFQIRRGNPNLKSYMCYRTELTYEWKKSIFYSNLWGAYDYRPNAIMDEKLQEGNKIVQTWDNQKDWQKLSGRLMLRVGPLWDMLQLSFTGGVNHYMSHGNNYSHTYTNWYYEGQASFNYKRFSLFWQINTNWNNFWGETLSGGENIQILGLYYKYKDLRLGVGAFNPFTDNYKVENENWNQFASYKTKSYIKESSRMFLVSLSYNFSFGRKFKATQRKVNNSDNESGVMSTGKIKSNYFPVNHVHRTVRNPCQSFIVSDNNKCLSETIAKIEEKLMQFFLIMSIQATRRFVSQYHSRMINKSTGYGHTLFFPTRKFIGLMPGTISQSHKLQQFQRRCSSLFLPHTGNKCRYHHVFQCREFW